MAAVRRCGRAVMMSGPVCGYVRGLGGQAGAACGSLRLVLASLGHELVSPLCLRGDRGPPVRLAGMMGVAGAVPVAPTAPLAT